ncbi:MAG: S1 RNA-binding domain-containing protein [Candidatus Bipolaricaulota bacterium]
MTPKVGDIIGGVVVEVGESGATISLPDGSCGFLHNSEMEQGSVPADSVGREVLVKVVGRDTNGRLVLSLRRLNSEDRQMAQFHDEVVQMRSALAERSLGMPQSQHTEDRIEWRLRSWLDQARDTLDRLEKRRAKRLTERIQR